MRQAVEVLMALFLLATGFAGSPAAAENTIAHLNKRREHLMGAAENKNKNSAMSAHLKAIGYPHGRRASVGLSAIPDPKDKGSAAYRRRTAVKS